MGFVTAFVLRPYAFWLAAGVAVAIYGALGWIATALWHRGDHWAAGGVALLILATAWKYVALLNQEIETAEGLECEGLLWVMRIPGLPGRGIYLLSHLGAGLLTAAAVAVPAHLVGVPAAIYLPIGLGLAAIAIRHRLANHPIARRFTPTGLPRDGGAQLKP